DVAVNEGGPLRFGKGAHFGRHDIAALEQHQRRDAADAVLRGRLLVVVDVELGDLELARVVVGVVVQYRRDHLAGAAALGPVIAPDRALGLQHFVVEVAVGQMVDVLAHDSSLRLAGGGDEGGSPRCRVTGAAGYGVLRGNANG